MNNRTKLTPQRLIREVLVEMATPRQSDLERVYYHGTPKSKNAKSIMARGINPPDLTGRSNYLTPVKGKVYITPKIDYAAIYAIGGDVAGNKVPDWMLDSYGKYGYLFVIDGHQLSDIQPDEDSIGEMIYSGEIDWLNDLAEDVLEFENYDVDDGITLGMYNAVMNGEYNAWAAAGKIALDSMTNEQKLELIDLGAHIAHTGKLMPSETWRFDRNRTADLARDGSNFFSLAERIS